MPMPRARRWSVANSQRMNTGQYYLGGRALSGSSNGFMLRREAAQLGQEPIGIGGTEEQTVTLETETVGPDFEARCVGPSDGRHEERHRTDEDEADRNQ